MKYLILMLLMVGCATKPKFKVNDCIHMMIPKITEKGDWDSSGHSLGMFKIVDIIHTDKMNKYMANRLHAFDFYKVKIIPMPFEKEPKSYKKDSFVIPIEDLDAFRWAVEFWELPENNKNNCNSYIDTKGN